MLTVELLGVDGITKTETMSFVNGEGYESVITMSKNENKIEISARNEEGLQYVTYKINDNPEVRTDANIEDNTIITREIDLEQVELNVGQNTITIIAVDVNNKEKVKEDVITGTADPEVSVIRSGDFLKCKIVHPLGFKEIIFNLNGKDYRYGEGSGNYKKEESTVERSIPVEPGENKLIIKAYSNEGTSKIYRGKITI